MAQIDLNNPAWGPVVSPKEIDFALLNEHGMSNVKKLLERYMPGGRFDGHEYKCASPHGGKGESCSTNVVTCIGREFNAGGKGWNDPVSLVSAATGKSMAESAKELAEWLCVDPYKLPPAPPRAVIQVESTDDKKSRARKMWSEGVPADIHPYTSRKQVPLHASLKVHPDTGMLMIPFMDEHGVLHSIQRIPSEGGEKKSLGPVSGNYFMFEGDASAVFICEGYATAASVAMATGNITVMCISTSNMIKVAEKINKLFPKSRIVFAADNDPKSDCSNPGVEAATEASKKIGRGEVIFPPTTDKSDWNDYHLSHGLDAAKALLIDKSRNRNGKKPAVFEVVDELMETDFEPINWAIEGILPEGLAVLSGPPKLGKSWLSLDFCLAIATGGLAAGQFPAEKGSVLLCALEDNKRRLKSRIEMRRGAGMKFALSGPLDFNVLSNPKLPGFYYTTELPRLDEGGMDAIISFLDSHPDCKLIVLDTLAKVKPNAKKNGNAYEQDYNDMGEVQRLALERRCCIMVITHNRKTETDDALQSISGSTGITGVMDTILILNRPRGGTSSTLYITGRDVSEHTWAMSFDGEHGAWEVKGDYEVGSDGVNSELQEEVMQVLITNFREAGRGMKLGQIFDAMGGEHLAPKKSNLSRTLNKLFNRGLIVKMGYDYIPKDNG